MTGVTLNEGGIADIDRVMTVMEVAFDPLFGEAWNRGQCLGMLALPDVWLMLASRGDLLVGFALSRMVADEVELLLLAVIPAARGGGIGRLLIERALAQARTRGAARLLLEVRAGNPAAALYETLGFARIGERRDYYRGVGGRLADAWTLARPIG